MKEQNTSKLILDLARYFEKEVRKEADPLGMRHSYRRLLPILTRNDGVSQYFLVRETGLRAPTISVTLRSMEERGLITRTQNPDDKREILISLTDEGRTLDQAVRRLIRRNEQKIESALDDADRAELCRLLIKMKTALGVPARVKE